MPTPDPRSAAARRRRRRRRLRLARTTVVVVLVVAAGAWALADLVPVLIPVGCRITGPDGSAMRLDPEQAANAATISGVGVGRGLPERAVVIGLATAVQESKLRNLAHGDRDSLGLFQQRPSQGWGTPAQIRDPVYASRAFFDRLVTVPDYLTRPLTEVAQEVQRSGYPEAYADHEEEAALAATAFAGADPTSLTCRLDPPATTVDADTVAAALERTFGVRARAEAAGLVVTTDTPRGAGAIAAWALGHAQEYGVGSVAVGGHTWTRGRGKEAARWAPTPGDGSTDRRVLVRLGGG